MLLDHNYIRVNGSLRRRRLVVFGNLSDWQRESFAVMSGEDFFLVCITGFLGFNATACECTIESEKFQTDSVIDEKTQKQYLHWLESFVGDEYTLIGFRRRRFGDECSDTVESDGSACDWLLRIAKFSDCARLRSPFANGSSKNWIWIFTLETYVRN